MIAMYYHGNLKDCLMKVLSLLLHLIKCFILHWILFVLKSRVKVNGDCLKQEKIIFNRGKIVNICIVYEVEKSVNISIYPTPQNCLFGAVKLAKHVDVDLYKYFGYGIGFDRKGCYLIGDEISRM